MSNVVDLKGHPAMEARQPRADVIEACEDLLAMAQAGELQGFVAGMQFADGSAGVSRGGSSTMALIGAIEEAKFRMLQERNTDE